MTKKQVEIAEIIVRFLREKNMAAHEKAINDYTDKHLSEFHHNDRVIALRMLRYDYNLIKKDANSFYRLTKEGDRFKSFKQLKRRSQIAALKSWLPIVISTIAVFFTALTYLERSKRPTKEDLNNALLGINKRIDSLIQTKEKIEVIPKGSITKSDSIPSYKDSENNH